MHMDHKFSEIDHVTPLFNLFLVVHLPTHSVTRWKSRFLQKGANGANGLLPRRSGPVNIQEDRPNVWLRTLSRITARGGKQIEASCYRKKEIPMAKKVEVRAKSCVPFQLRGLRFKWKYHIPTTFAQGIVWHPRESLKWLKTKPDFRIFKPFYRAL